MSHQIPPGWLPDVRAYVRSTTGEDRDHLRAHDFKPGRSVRLDFPDGSFALFRYAICLRDEELEEVAVFTEHCGYFFLPAEELRVEVLESVPHEAGWDGDDVERPA